MFLICALAIGFTLVWSPFAKVIDASLKSFNASLPFTLKH